MRYRRNKFVQTLRRKFDGAAFFGILIRGHQKLYYFEPIFEGLERARLRAQGELGLSVYWIFDAVRHFTVPEAERVFQKAAAMRGEPLPALSDVVLDGSSTKASDQRP